MSHIINVSCFQSFNKKKKSPQDLHPLVTMGQVGNCDLICIPWDFLQITIWNAIFLHCYSNLYVKILLFIVTYSQSGKGPISSISFYHSMVLMEPWKSSGSWWEDPHSDKCCSHSLPNLFYAGTKRPLEMNNPNIKITAYQLIKMSPIGIGNSLSK